ncbi:MAG: hypothetical protein LBR17_01205 [Bacteroidales bacterium]|nr:hypothetical protein [Bacteroidales bacterium]
MKKYLFLSLLGLMEIAVIACSEEESNNDYSIKASSYYNNSNGLLVLGQKLPNPYSLTNMQAAYNDVIAELGSNPTNEYVHLTDLYVRFLPADSAELSILRDDDGLELFDYPLDYEILSTEGRFYQDPKLSSSNNGDITWLYTTVPPNYNFHQSIQYEILDSCFIPQEDINTSTNVAEFFAKVEQQSFENAGILNMFDTDNDGTTQYKGWLSGYYPKGTFRVEDNDLSNYAGIKRVKIRCNVIVKWASTYTNDNGYYEMGKKFRICPIYAIKFENNLDFKIWDKDCPILTASYYMGSHSKKGHSRDIGTNSTAWNLATINNAAYDYYIMCDATQIHRPPSNLRIMLLGGTTSGSAAMVRRIYNHPIIINTANFLVNFYTSVSSPQLVNSLIAAFGWVLPDITIGANSTHSKNIYNRVNHELAHSCHYGLAGDNYWAEYASFIANSYANGYGTYGNMSLSNSGYCGVGEMWGYTMGNLQEIQKYGGSSTNGHGYWFKPQILQELVTEGVLTPKQIYDCLIPDVISHALLKQKLRQEYPSNDRQIRLKFEEYGF